MASTIIETDPQTGVDQPVAVIRNNFIRAKIEIEELQEGKMDKSGGVFTGIITLVSFAVADLPSATANLGGVVMVLDHEANPVPAYSNGTNWLKFSDESVIA